MPDTQITIIDPGKPNIPANGRIPCFIAVSTTGTVNAITSHNTVQGVVDAHGVSSPMAQAAAWTLNRAGGPAYCLPINPSVVGVASAVTATPVGTGTGTITVAGAPYNDFDVIVEITTTGTNSTGAFKYSLDGGTTYSGILTIPATTYVIPESGLTLTFVPGAGAVFFEDGDVHTFTCTAPYYSTTDLGTAIAALKANGSYTPTGGIYLIGNPPDAATGATMYAALEAHVQAYQTLKVWTFAAMNAGNDTEANLLTGYVSAAGTRTGAAVGTCDIATQIPFPGYGVPTVPTVIVAAGELVKRPISESLGRTATGAIPGVNAISYNEETTGLLRGKGFITMRTSVGDPGFYFYEGGLRAPSTSDYKKLRYRRVMDEICRVAYFAGKRYEDAAIKLKTDGTGRIAEIQAILIESFINGALNSAVMDPLNSEGFKGHASGVSVVVDREFNVLASDAIQININAVPLGYSDTVSIFVGLSASTGAN